MKKTIPKPLRMAADIVFPRRCPFCDELLFFGRNGPCDRCGPRLHRIGNDFCLKCGKPITDPGSEYCKTCASGDRAFDMGRSLFFYDDLLKHSLSSLKYNNKREYAQYFGAELAKTFAKTIRSERFDAIVPVPISRDRMKKRGYNQAELIAAEVSRITGIPLRNDIITREKDTVAQKELGRAARQKNLKKAFKITGNVVELETIMVIDDIYTTGSTMSETARVLKEAGVKKVCFFTVASGSAI
ncbi:MAG: ComF family protein [Lachnospiraceae bacterium]|nr:ComF family protein [Lachnospiraceae bacterium]